MALIPDDVISEIRQRADIATVIGEHLALRKVGASMKGLCPFHAEKTPSFHVSPQRQLYYCYGCHAGGDVFRFLMTLQGKSFVEVARELAQRHGITIPERPQSDDERRQRGERSRMHELTEAATAYFRDRLFDDAGGQLGQRYLDSRGIGSEVAETFRLGLAGPEWSGLAEHLAARNLSMPLAEEVGLVAPRQRAGGHYDKFRGRLMCPVILPGGEVAGFSGRTLLDDPEAPKYTNSSESVIYKKSHLLFGLHAARAAFRSKGRAVLVEGNFDVIALHQAGFSESVAPLGTALTPQQIELLRRLAPSITLCLDGDRAGKQAALKNIPLLVAAGVEARVAELPDGDDPDSLVRRDPARFGELLDRARPAIEYFLDQLWHRTDRSATHRANAVREAAPLLASIGDRIKRDIVVDQFATALAVPAQVVRRAMAEAGSVQGAPARGSSDRVVPSRSALPHDSTATPADLRGPPDERFNASPDERFNASPDERPNDRSNERPNDRSNDRPNDRSNDRSDRPLPPRVELELVRLLADHPFLASHAEDGVLGSLLTDDRVRVMYAAALVGRPLDEVTPRELSDVVAAQQFTSSPESPDDAQRALDECANLLRRAHHARTADAIGLALQDAERRGDSARARDLLQLQLETRRKASARHDR